MSVAATVTIARMGKNGRVWRERHFVDPEGCIRLHVGTLVGAAAELDCIVIVAPPAGARRPEGGGG